MTVMSSMTVMLRTMTVMRELHPSMFRSSTVLFRASP